MWGAQLCDYMCVCVCVRMCLKGVACARVYVHLWSKASAFEYNLKGVLRDWWNLVSTPARACAHACTHERMHSTDSFIARAHVRRCVVLNQSSWNFVIPPPPSLYCPCYPRSEIAIGSRGIIITKIFSSRLPLPLLWLCNFSSFSSSINWRWCISTPIQPLRAIWLDDR